VTYLAKDRGLAKEVASKIAESSIRFNFCDGFFFQTIFSVAGYVTLFRAICLASPLRDKSLGVMHFLFAKYSEQQILICLPNAGQIHCGSVRITQIDYTRNAFGGYEVTQPKVNR